MNSGKKGTKATLAELVAERPLAGEDEAAAADIEYVEKHGIPKSKLPEYYQSIRGRMEQLDELQKTIDTMAAEKAGRVNYFGRLAKILKKTVVSVQRTETIDELMESEIEIMQALGSDTRKAIRHVNNEAGRLRNYADYVMREFDSAKTSLLSTNAKYSATKKKAEQLETEVRSTPLMAAEFTGKKMDYDNEKRELSRLDNRRYVYAARTKFRILERRTVVEREDAVRNILYEMQKMSDSTAMFLQSIEQTHSATTVLQMAYKTGEALHTSYDKLSDIATANGLIAVAAIQRFSGIAEQAGYDFPQRQMEDARRQKNASAGSHRTDLVTEVLGMLEKPIIDTSVPSGGNGYGGGYEAQKQMLETLR